MDGGSGRFAAHSCENNERALTNKRTLFGQMNVRDIGLPGPE